MEITMTLTVSPEKAVEIARLLQTTPTPQQNAAPVMQQPTLSQIPAQPNPMPSNPFAAVPQQMSAPAQQPGIPAAIPQSAPVQGCPIPQQTAAAPAAVPQSAPTYSIQDLTLAARPLMEMGRQAELAQLLTQFGVKAVAELPENQRANFAASLRAMGGQI